MIQRYPASSRYSVSHGWLSTNLSFSFAEYYDPNNTSFGPMRVLNDDTIAPSRGFGAHPHSDMEIVSIVLSGKMRHEDNLGNLSITEFGQVQRMTAGAGAIHTEHNASDTEPLNLLQMWFLPTQRGLNPSYEAIDFEKSRLDGQLLPVVSENGGPSIAQIHQDMTIYLSRLKSNETIQFEQEDGRRIFLFVIDGALRVNEQELQTRDSARIEETPSLALTGISDDVFFMLIDLP